jgi:subtilisin family serine protease
VVSSTVADALESSDLKRLLAGNKLVSVRALFTDEAIRPMMRAVNTARGIAVDAMPALFADTIPKLLQGRMLLQFPSAKEAQAALNKLALDPLVASVHQPQMRVHCADPLEPEQWGIQAIGGSQGIVNSASGVTIAVIDSGVDDGHADLIGRVSKINCHPDKPDGSDDDGHGTHCIGVIAAQAGNGFGVRGVCRPSQVISYRVFSPFDSGGYYDALQKAVDRDGARVISLSVAGERDDTETELIRAAVSKGVVVCAAAGNDGQTIDRLPAALSREIDGVIAVGAMTIGRQVASFSNVGSHLDVVAPGDQIVSTYPRHLQPRVMQPGQPFEMMSGTSMATPFVAAAAAIVLHGDPTLTPKQVRDKLRSSARKLAGQTGHTNEAGFGCVAIS